MLSDGTKRSSCSVLLFVPVPPLLPAPMPVPPPLPAPILVSFPLSLLLLALPALPSSFLLPSRSSSSSNHPASSGFLLFLSRPALPPVVSTLANAGDRGGGCGGRFGAVVSAVLLSGCCCNECGGECGGEHAGERWRVQILHCFSLPSWIHLGLHCSMMCREAICFHHGIRHRIRHGVRSEPASQGCFTNGSFGGIPLANPNWKVFSFRAHLRPVCSCAGHTVLHCFCCSFFCSPYELCIPADECLYGLASSLSGQILPIALA